LTFGFLIGEIIRRVSGKTVGRFLADEVVKPLNLSLWIGLPQSEETRLAPLFNSKFADDEFNWFLNLHESRNGVEIPSGNGIGDGQSLAKMFAATIGEVDGTRLLQSETMERARATKTDSLSLAPNPFMPQMPQLKQRFALGYETSYAASPMLGAGSFGHSGKGGRLGFAHPESGIAVGYVCNNTTWKPFEGPDTRWVPWLKALGEIAKS